MSFQGQELTAGMRQMIVNLKSHFDAEKKIGEFVPTKNSTKRVAEGLGIGEATVKRVMADQKKGEAQKRNIHDKERGKPPYRLSTNLQPVIREFIRSKNLKGQKISAEQIREHLDEQYGVDIPNSTLLDSLKRFGFVYSTGKRRCALKEQTSVVLARRKYLRQKMANRNLDGSVKRPEVYLDESYVNKNHSNEFTWYFDEDGPWVNKPSGKGPRLIIVHAITKDGWVDGAQLVFDAKRRTGDYHGQMSWENFSKWFSDQLLPNIPANSLLIMDNAKYHNVYVEDAFPTVKTRKNQLIDWLEINNLPWQSDMLKPELYTLCRRFAPIPDYRLDRIAAAAGHKILRTPPYHPELQPIETCWGIVKNELADKCDFTMSNLRYQLPKAFAKVKGHTCQDLIVKVAKQEEKFWAEDNKLDEMYEDNCDSDIVFNDFNFIPEIT